MKKFIAIAIAALSMNAFAQKSMVTLSGYETGNDTDRSVDFSNVTGGSAHVGERNIALNYAYAVTDAFQVGVLYKSHENKTGGDIASPGDKTSTYGLKVIYNFAHQLADTNYLSLGYETSKSDDSANNASDDGYKVNTWALEFGHRFSLGTIWGMNFNYSPSAAFSVSDIVGSDSAVVNDASYTSVTLNFVKFDVLF